MNTASSSRMVRVDGLRGVAVLAVVLFHAGYFLIPSLDANLLPGGFVGVDLFFVLSGFLMTHILAEGRQSYTRFYLRRAARILPALYIFLAAQLVYSCVTGSGVVADLRADLLIGLGMGNWGSTVGVTLPFGSGQTWSLGVEEQLYLVWPLAVILLARRDPKRIAWLSGAGIAISMASKVAMYHAGVSPVDIYGQTEGRLDEFLAGALVATVVARGLFLRRVQQPLTAAAFLVLAASLATAHPFTSAWLYDGGFTLVALSGAVVLYGAVHQTAETRLLGARPLLAAGRYSYSIYLWHPLVFLAASRALPHDTGLRVALAAVALVSLSVGSTRLVEEPLRRWAAGFHRPPRRPVSAVT